MKKIYEVDYESLCNLEEDAYTLEEIEKLEEAGAFNVEKINLEVALDELEELRGDDVLF